MTFMKFLDCSLFKLGGNDIFENIDYHVIRNRNHGIILQGVNKLALNGFVDKRKYVNNITSKPWD